MTLESQLELCTYHYKKWKQRALEAKDLPEGKKALEHAFFWLELHSAFVALHAVEQTNGKDAKIRNKLLIAKTNLSRKLADYANEVLDEIKL
ncbi:MAG TPA: hypothetical protein VJJ76_01755 [archaeon]|nr:hypothetical protein [archaeon]